MFLDAIPENPAMSAFLSLLHIIVYLSSILSEAPYTISKPFNEQPPYKMDCRFPQLSSSSALSSDKPIYIA